MALKKCLAERLVGIYGFQATNRKHGGLAVRAPLPRSISMGHLGVIYGFHSAYSKYIANRWNLLRLDLKIASNNF